MGIFYHFHLTSSIQHLSNVLQTFLFYKTWLDFVIYLPCLAGITTSGWLEHYFVRLGDSNNRQTERPKLQIKKNSQLSLTIWLVCIAWSLAGLSNQSDQLVSTAGRLAGPSRHPLMITFDGRGPLMEYNIWWKRTFDGRWTVMVENF